MTYSLLRLGVSCATLGLSCGFAVSASAFDPYTAPRQMLPQHIVPSRYYANSSGAIPTPAPVAPISAPVAAHSPIPASQPEPEITFTMTSPAEPAPSSIPTPAPAVAPPLQTATVNPAPVIESAPLYAAAQPLPPVPARQTAEPGRNFNAPGGTPREKHEFTVGIESYHNKYQETDIDLTQTGTFSGISASYTRNFDPYLYTSLEVRGSTGQADTESIDGTMEDSEQWDVESRLLFGGKRLLSGDRSIKAYIGLGSRYFSDESKNKITSLGEYGYDRRVLQFYVPIGMTYEFSALGLTFAPNIEIDPMLWGNVNSRLSNIPSDPAYYSIDNEQSKGLGFRGEFLVGQRYDNGMGWQFGPFFRYWNIPDSNVTFDPNGDDWIELENRRIEAGASLKMLF